ncbi:DUF3822 family protein [Aquimarina litoralis]|uniref:DUF3822 family protein n=1 Tax=Aquimarina litoralis TaxID=584605 RepID=UPI001C5A0170|nr:DUF3822 family protein [Aquimarina litoralis]MBW1296603.1 DUF3822 family protein [Aquimarina litoralis]
MTQTLEQQKSNTSGNTKHTLSIQVSLNGLSFCISNSEKQIIALEQDNFGINLSPEQVLDKIKYIFDHDPNFKNDFEKIEVIYQNDLYSCVPKALFDKDSLKDYLKYNIKVLENDFIAHDELDQHDIIVVYIPYTNINNFFFETFGSFTYKHATTILIDTLLAKEKNTEATKVFAHMNSKSFDLVITSKGKLLLSNSYPYETEEDFLYYVMFAAEQLRLNPEEFELIFLGTVSETSNCYEIAYKYIRHVDFGSRNTVINILEPLAPIHEHEHYLLLSHF